MDTSHVKILAPVGNFAMLQAAIKAGADEVYFGSNLFSMRAGSNNFSPDQFAELAQICHQNNVKAYLTVNVVLYDEDILAAQTIIRQAKEAAIDGVICMDFAAIKYAHSIGMETHISVQAGVSNVEAVKHYSQFSDRVVLARELNIKQHGYIVLQIQQQQIKGPSGRLVEVEVFAHGALCVSVSGKCGMSLLSNNQSANRGACTQPCRRPYKVIDKETGQEFEIDNEYVMSSSDLCTLGFLDEIVESGVSVLKIEGRQKTPEYVDMIVKTYKNALNSISNKTYSQKAIDGWLEDLATVYNRGLSSGYYLGKKIKDWSGAAASRATTKKTYVGTVKHFFDKLNVVEFELHSNKICVNDELIVMGDKTGVVKVKLLELRNQNQEQVLEVEKGQIGTFKVGEACKENDKIYLVESTGFKLK